MVTRVTFPPVQGEWVRATEYEALAAHLERMTDLATAVFAANNVSAIAGIAQLLEAVDEAPTSSLSRLKAEWQAAAISEWAARHLGGHEQELAEIYAAEIRHQAEGGE